MQSNRKTKRATLATRLNWLTRPPAFRDHPKAPRLAIGNHRAFTNLLLFVRFPGKHHGRLVAASQTGRLRSAHRAFTLSSDGTLLLPQLWLTPTCSERFSRLLVCRLSRLLRNVPYSVFVRFSRFSIRIPCCWKVVYPAAYWNHS